MGAITLFLCGVTIAFTTSLAIDEAMENYRLKNRVYKLESELDNKKLLEEIKEFDDNVS